MRFLLLITFTLLFTYSLSAQQRAIAPQKTTLAKAKLSTQQAAYALPPSALKKPDTPLPITAETIEIEWLDANGRRLSKKITWYADCAAFYAANPAVDPDKVDCTNVSIASGKRCDLVDGSPSYNTCEEVICSACTTCEEMAGYAARMGKILLFCKVTAAGPVAKLGDKPTAIDNRKRDF